MSLHRRVIAILLAAGLFVVSGCGDTTTVVDDGNGGGVSQYGFQLSRYGTEFSGIWMFADDEWVACGADGMILHFDGGIVTAMESGTRADLNDIWAAGRDDIFVVGNPEDGSGAGVILHYDGNEWSHMPFTAQVYVKGVGGLTGTNVWAVSVEGYVYHYDGADWTEVYQRPGGDALRDVMAVGLTNVVAVGDNGGIVRWDGGSWSDDSVIGDDFKAVCGSAYNDIWVCGGEQIWHYDGSWSLAYRSGMVDLRAIHNMGRNIIWAAGGNNRCVRYDGGSWLTQVVGDENQFDAVWVRASDLVVALSDHGGVYQYDGAVWDEINNSDQSSWPDMHGLASDEIYAVSGLNLAKWDGVEWSGESSHNAHMMSVWAFAENDIYTTGWPWSGSLRYVYHYDGSSWSQSYSLDWIFFSDLWGADPDNLFAVTWNGDVAYYDGVGWDTTQVDPRVELHGVWGTSVDDVFVVGEVGTIHHKNSTGWENMSPDNVDHLMGVWGTSSSDVVAVGMRGTIVRYDGAQWNAENAGTTESLQAVWGDATDNYWAVGYNGVVLHNDGTGWKRVATGIPTEPMDCVWGVGTDVWIAGANDYMMRYVELK